MASKPTNKNTRDLGGKPKVTSRVCEKSKSRPNSLNPPHRQASKTNSKSIQQNGGLTVKPNYPSNENKAPKGPSSDVESVGGGRSEHGVDLASPGLRSALHLANQIKAAELNDVPLVKLSKLRELQAKFQQKAVKKTNVPFSEHIFSDLVDLQIADEDIVSGKKLPLKNYEFGQNKDKVFKLEDFYKPDFSLEFNVKVPFQKRDIEKIQHYDGFEIYDRMESLPKCS